MRDFIAITKALSDETRVRIMKILEQGELCVCELMAILEMKQSTVSKHLGILHAAGLVQRRRVGPWCYYRLSEKAVSKYQPAFQELLRQALNEDERVCQDRKRLERLKSGAASCNHRPLEAKKSAPLQIPGQA